MYIRFVHCCILLSNAVYECHYMGWLCIRTCVCRFIQSFNRPNLKYCVRVKRPKGIVQDIGDLISLRYKDQCGIVYCLSRSVYLADDWHTQWLGCCTICVYPCTHGQDCPGWSHTDLHAHPCIVVYQCLPTLSSAPPWRRDCEVMSDALWQDHQIAACAYHGGMSDPERAEVQLRWATSDSCKVLYCSVLYMLNSAWCCIMWLQGCSY